MEENVILFKILTTPIIDPKLSGVTGEKHKEYYLWHVRGLKLCFLYLLKSEQRIIRNKKNNKKKVKN